MGLKATELSGGWEAFPVLLMLRLKAGKHYRSCIQTVWDWE